MILYTPLQGKVNINFFKPNPAISTPKGKYTTKPILWLLVNLTYYFSNS